MTREEHRARHVELHRALDELLADYLRHNRGALPSQVSALDLARWAYAQTVDPTEEPEIEPPSTAEGPT
jgi:hypothetical protein